jgi:hypothetical protein
MNSLVERQIDRNIPLLLALPRAAAESNQSGELREAADRTTFSSLYPPQEQKTAPMPHMNPRNLLILK